MSLGRAKAVFRGVVPSAGNLARLTNLALTKMVEESRRGVRARAQSAFDVGGHHPRGGRAWARLRLSTIAQKRAEGAARPSAPLVRTGAMQRNMMAMVSLRVIGNSIRYTITTWNNKMYSLPHQKGYFNKRTGTFVPARPPAQITKRDLQYVESIIRKYMPPPPKGWRKWFGRGK